MMLAPQSLTEKEFGLPGASFCGFRTATSLPVILFVGGEINPLDKYCPALSL
jgi:hypothetical protein